MAEGIRYFNFAIASGALTAAFLGFLLTLASSYIERWERRYFIAVFSALFAYAASDLVEQVSLALLGPDFRWLSEAGICCELLFSTVVIPLITAYLMRSTGGGRGYARLVRAMVAVWVLYAALLVSAQLNDAAYSISADNRQILINPLYPALVAIPIALLVVDLIVLVAVGIRLAPRRRIAFSVYIVVPLVSVALQTAFFDVRIVVIGAVVATCAMFGFELADQMEAHDRAREESARRQAQVMALRMRPHFIYNVMTSIYYLCAADPARAQEVTLDFTDYLRANFEATAQEGEVPFARELEHTRAYLAVEQARLEGGILVEFDCPHTAFRLPPLTLQPLVENAVKHGADPELPPLRVRISTREEPGFSVVTVEDTGPGFADAADGAPAGAPEDAGLREGPLGEAVFSDSSANPATALANVRERLAACNSTLEIAKRAGGGTVATIRVPA